MKRINTGLGSFTARTANALIQAVITDLEQRVVLAITDRTQSDRKVLRAIARELDKNVSTKVKKTFQVHMRDLTRRALNPKRRKQLANEAATTFENGQTSEAVKRMLERLDNQKFKAGTVKSIAWYKSKGYRSYREYDARKEVEEPALVDQTRIRLRIYAELGEDSNASFRLRHILANEYNQMNKYRKGFVPVKAENFKLNKMYDRKWGFETGAFADSMSQAQFVLKRLEFREQLNKYAALGSAEAAKEKIVQAVEVSLSGLKNDEAIAQRIRRVLNGDDPVAQFRVSIGFSFNPKTDPVNEGIYRKYVAAGFTADKFPGTSKDLAALALVKAFNSKSPVKGSKIKR